MASRVAVTDSSLYRVSVSSFFSLPRERAIGLSANLNEQDVGSRFGEGDGDSLTDATGAACQQGGLTLEREQRRSHDGKGPLRLRN